MMIGELNYNGILFALIYHDLFLPDIFDGKTAYQPYTAVHFSVFVFVMTIIILSMTTGLATANIQKSFEDAKYKNLALQVVDLFHHYFQAPGTGIGNDDWDGDWE